MIYFKGPKAPDFHFEKSRPSLKRIASQAYRRKKAARPIVYSFRSESSGSPSGNPASRSPLSADRGFVLLSFPLPVKDSSALPSHWERPRRAFTVSHPRLPCQHTDTQSGGFFSFFSAVCGPLGRRVRFPRPDTGRR